MNKPIESKTSESFSNLRKPSNQDDEDFLGGISRADQEEKLGSSSGRPFDKFINIKKKVSINTKSSVSVLLAVF
jgi:hypothetical protein